MSLVFFTFPLQSCSSINLSILYATSVFASLHFLVLFYVQTQKYEVSLQSFIIVQSFVIGILLQQITYIVYV